MPLFTKLTRGQYFRGKPTLAPKKSPGSAPKLDEKATKLHRRVLPIMTLYTLSEPGISAIKSAMAKLGVPISPHVRGPALLVTDEAQRKVDNVLKGAGLTTVPE